MPTGEPLSYISRPVRTPTRPWATSEIVCWAIVAFITAGLAGLAAFRAEDRPPKAPGGVLSATAPSNMQLPFLAKYTIAVNELEKNFSAMDATTKRQFTDNLFRSVGSAQDEIRAEIVSRELNGSSFHAFDGPPLGLGSNPEVQTDWQDFSLLEGQPNDSLQDQPAEAMSTRLKKRYGWFADLAFSWGRPATDPLRQKVLADAYFTLAVAGVGVVALILAGVAGLVLLIIAIVRLVTRKMRLAFSVGAGQNGSPADRRTLLQGFCFYLAGYVVLALAARYIFHLGGLWPDAIGLPVGFFLGLSWPLLSGHSLADWKLALGLSRGRGIIREMISGIAGYLAGLPVVALAAFVTAVLAALTHIHPNPHPIEQDLFGGPWSIVMVFFLASVWAPITEELMFRGALFSSLRERFGWWISAPIMALAFAAIHPQGWVAIPVLGSLALALAGIREWRGSIIGCMTAHCLNNTTAICAVLFLMRS